MQQSIWKWTQLLGLNPPLTWEIFQTVSVKYICGWSNGPRKDKSLCFVWFNTVSLFFKEDLVTLFILFQYSEWSLMVSVANMQIGTGNWNAKESRLLATTWRGVSARHKEKEERRGQGVFFHMQNCLQDKWAMIGSLLHVPYVANVIQMPGTADSKLCWYCLKRPLPF